MIKGLRNGCLQGVTDLISHYDHGRGMFRKGYSGSKRRGLLPNVKTNRFQNSVPDLKRCHVCSRYVKVGMC